MKRFSLGTPVSSTNKNDCYDITEILLKVALEKKFPILVFSAFSLSFQTSHQKSLEDFGVSVDILPAERV
jgi:hypothetical protein